MNDGECQLYLNVLAYEYRKSIRFLRDYKEITEDVAVEAMTRAAEEASYAIKVANLALPHLKEGFGDEHDVYLMLRMALSRV